MLSIVKPFIMLDDLNGHFSTFNFSICFKHTIMLIKRSKKLNSIKKFNKIWLFQFFWSLLISFFVLFTLRFLICFVLDITDFFWTFYQFAPPDLFLATPLVFECVSGGGVGVYVGVCGCGCGCICLFRHLWA